MPTIKPDPAHYQKIIMLRTDRIGDMLVSTPCFRALRQALPTARIDLIASPLNAVAVQHNPYIDHTFIFSLHKPWLWPGLLWTLRAQKYDAAFTFNSNSRSASRLTRLLGAKERIGFSGLPPNCTHKEGVYTWLPEGGPNPHVIIDMLHKINSLGIPASSPHLDFVVPRDISETMKQRFPHTPGRMRLAIFIGNIKKVQNRWPVEKFRELTVRLLSAEKDLDIVIVAGPSDRPLLQAFSDLDHPCLSLFVGDTLQETGGLLQNCCALVAGSSGPTHVAASQDVPVLAIVTQYNAAIWPPLGEHDACVTPDSDIRDMRGIAVDPVEAMVRTFLSAERLKAKASLP